MSIINSGSGFYVGRRFDVQLSAELRHRGDLIFERQIGYNRVFELQGFVSFTDNTFTIPNHFFRTGEKLLYEYDDFQNGTTNAIGIATTTTQAGITSVIPLFVYAIAVDERTIQVAGTKEEALRRIPKPLDLTTVGAGTYHKFIGEKQNTRSLITVDNVIQTPAIDTEIVTTLAEDLSGVSDFVRVVGVNSFFPGDLIRIGQEIMKINLVQDENNAFIVRRPLLGTGLQDSSAGSKVVKQTGAYKIVDSIIYFPVPPFEKSPTTDFERKDPLDRDYVGLETFSTFDGRVFLRSGFEDTEIGPYDRNFLLDDISNQFLGISTQGVLKEQGSNIAGFSTGNALVLINNVFQTPDFIDYGLGESSGITTISFTGKATSNPEDINSSSIPRGGIIVSIGTSEGYGYQPLVAAGGTANVSAGGTIKSVSIGYTGSGYRAPEIYTLKTRISSPTFAPNGNRFYLDDENGLFKQLEYFNPSEYPGNGSKCSISIKDSIGNNIISSNDFNRIVSVGDTYVDINPSTAVDAWSLVFDSTSFIFFSSTNVISASGIATNRIRVASVAGIDTGADDYYLSIGSVASNILIEDVDEVNSIFILENNTSAGYVDNSAVTIKTFQSGIEQTNVGDIVYITVTEPSVGVANVYVNTKRAFSATSGDYTDNTGITTIKAPGFDVDKGETVELRNFIYKCNSGGTFGDAQGSFNKRLGINSITVDTQIYSVLDATYEPISGIATLNIGPHELTSERFYIESEGLGFSCTLDSNATTSYYPGPNDANYRKTYDIISTTATTVVVDVGAAGTNTSDHTFERVNNSTLSDPYTVTAATYDGSTGLSTITFNGAHGLTSSISYDALYADYEPISGIATIAITADSHPLQIGDKILLSPESLGFTCTTDGNVEVTYYPRPVALDGDPDPLYDTFATISGIGATTIEFVAGASVDTSEHTFVGVNTITPKPIKVASGDYIFLDEEGLRFYCDLGGPTDVFGYPREESPITGDPDYAYNNLLEILEVPTASSVVVYVGYTEDPLAISPHTFVDSTPNAVRSSTGQSRYSSGIVTVTNEGDVSNTLNAGNLVLFKNTGTLLDDNIFTVVNSPLVYGSSSNAFTIDTNELLLPAPKNIDLNSPGDFVLATISLPSGKFGFEFEVLEVFSDGSFVVNTGTNVSANKSTYVGGGVVKNSSRGKNPEHIGVSSIKDGYLVDIEITNVGAGFTQYDLFSKTNLFSAASLGDSTVRISNAIGINTYTDYVTIREGETYLSKILSITEGTNFFDLEIEPSMSGDAEIKSEVEIYRFDRFELDIDDPLSYDNLSLVYSPSSEIGIGSYASANIRVGNDGRVKEVELLNSGYSYGQGELLTVPVGGVTGIPTFGVINQVTGISTAVGIFTGSIISNDDRFGFSVAISAGGTTMAVSSPYGEGEELNAAGLGTASGAVYIFDDQSGIGYTQVGIITGQYSSDFEDNFGYSVAMSSDGWRIAVGAPFDEFPDAGITTGLVYMFDRSAGDTFTQVGILSTLDDTNSSQFGFDVDMSSDGNVIVVGSPFENTTGKIHVFEREPGPSFIGVATLSGSAASLSDDFGASVAISPEGQFIAVGAPEDEDTVNQFTNFGVVYIFEKTGSIVNQVGIITSPKLTTLKSSADKFGSSVDISKNGEIVAVSAVDDKTAIGEPTSGIVYVYEKIEGEYYLISKLQGIYSTEDDDDFGNSISLSDDGEVLVVGAKNDERPDLENSTGLSYIYERRTRNYLGNDFVNIGITTGFYSNNLNDNYGSSVAISPDKTSIIVGAQYDEISTTGIGTSGVAYVYDITVGNIFEEFLISVDRTFTDEFAGYVFGDLVVFDDISRLFNGKRVEFPIRLNGLQTTLRARPGSTLELEYNLLVFINDIYQIPNQSYSFEGGSILTFLEAPKEGDKCVIIFYYGTTEVDTRLVDILETIKIGDEVTVNADVISLQQDPRVVTDIRSTDTIETNVYSTPGVTEDNQLERPITWCKQLVDKVIDGNVVGKSRSPYEPQILSKTQVIQPLGIGTEEVFVENVRTFFDSDDEYEDVGINKRPQNDIIIISNDEEVTATGNAFVGNDLRISSVSISNVGSGYTSSDPPDISFSSPAFAGIGTTVFEVAQATLEITNGSISGVNLTNPGYGYTTNQVLKVLISPPKTKYEVIEDVVYEGDFGWITGIGTTSTLSSENNFVFELYITEDSFLRDESIVGTQVKESTIQENYFFRVSKSNVGNGTDIGYGITSYYNGTTDILFNGDKFLDGVYNVSSVSIARTEVPGLTVGFGRTDIVRVTVPVQSYNGIDVESGGFIGTIGGGPGVGYTYAQYFGNYSWGRISSMNRSLPQDFGFYNNGDSGINSSPTILRVNPLKSEGYTPN